MFAIRQDVACAVRSLRKAPAFTISVVLLLALGIGANVAIFSLVRAVVLKPLPFHEPDKLMLVHMLGPDRDAPGAFRRFIWSYPKIPLYRDSQKAFESTAAFTSSGWNLTGAGSADRIVGELVEASYFSTLGVDAIAGRSFSASETASPGSEPIVLLGHGIWTGRFGGSPVVGPARIAGCARTTGAEREPNGNFTRTRPPRTSADTRRKEPGKDGDQHQPERQDRIRSRVSVWSSSGCRGPVPGAKCRGAVLGAECAVCSAGLQARRNEPETYVWLEAGRKPAAMR